MRRRRASKGPSIRALVRKEIQRAAEKKSYKASNSGTVGSISGTLLQLDGITQGDQDDNRDGNQVNITKVFGRVALNWVPDGTPDGFVRALIVQSRGGALTTTDMPNIHLYADQDRFHVLKDVLIPMQCTGDNSAGNYTHSPQVFDFNLKLSLKQHYDDGSSLPRQNALYLFLYATDATIDHNTWWVTKFTDV